MLSNSALRARGTGSSVRSAVWVGHLILPLLALWLLLAQPDLDVHWQHRPSHFWLVAAVALINMALAARVLEAAQRRGDARVLIVGYAFMVAAGFLALHALATPGVIVGSANGGFEIATPVGLALASILFAVSTVTFSDGQSQRIVARHRSVRLGLAILMVAWGVVSLAGLPPLDAPLSERASGGLRWVAFASIALYLLAAIGFFRAHRKRPSVMLIALMTAAVLLAEAMATIVWARTWQLSWWLWHLLMAAAFGFVAYSAYSQYEREGGAAGIFDGIVSRATAEKIRDDYGSALDTLTEALQRSVVAGTTDQEIDLVISGLGARLSLTEGQTEVLARAARSLATEREQAKRLGALALIATGVRVEKGEEEVLAEIVPILAERFDPDVVRIGLKTDEILVYPDHLATGQWPGNANEHSESISIGSEAVGVVEFARVGRQFRPRDLSIMETLAAEIGIALENVRLYSQVDHLFRTYLSPDVASTLKEDPKLADLGGSVVELTALFADLRGYTTFSEGTDPRAVMELLNSYFGKAVPIVLRNGGTVVQFVGDALFAVFDAPTARPDHEFRAARAALEMQDAIADEGSDDSAQPRFRIGVNTGLALIGNLGSEEMRSFSVVGDAVNIASRLETSAEEGTVVVSDSTYRAIADRVEATEIGPLQLKGKSQRVTAYKLERIVEPAGSLPTETAD